MDILDEPLVSIFAGAFLLGVLIHVPAVHRRVLPGAHRARLIRSVFRSHLATPIAPLAFSAFFAMAGLSPSTAAETLWIPRHPSVSHPRGSPPTMHPESSIIVAEATCNDVILFLTSTLGREEVAISCEAVSGGTASYTWITPTQPLEEYRRYELEFHLDNVSVIEYEIFTTRRTALPRLVTPPALGVDHSSTTAWCNHSLQFTAEPKGIAGIPFMVELQLLNKEDQRWSWIKRLFVWPVSYPKPIFVGIPFSTCDPSSGTHVYVAGSRDHSANFTVRVLTRDVFRRESAGPPEHVKIPAGDYRGEDR